MLNHLVATGVLTEGEAILGRHLAALYGESDDLLLATTALTIASTRAGSVCLDLARADDLADLLAPEPAPGAPAASTRIPWPTRDLWRESILASPMAFSDGPPGDHALRLDGDQVYLTRSWQEQENVAAHLSRRATPRIVDESRLAEIVDRLFPAEPAPPGSTPDDPQRAAALTAARWGLTVVAGGPGTGKTTTAARILATIASLAASPPRIALTAPTGKASARLDAAVRGELADLGDAFPIARCPITSGTVHRLIGLKPWGAVDHDRDRPLPADIVVVDETSMLSLHHMALLLDALREDAHLILIGDPDQLASVDAGAVLSDIVASADDHPHRADPASADHAEPIPLVRLTRTYRFSGALQDLATAIRQGDRSRAAEVLATDDPMIEFIDTDVTAPGFATAKLTRLADEVRAQSRAMIEAALEGDAPAALTALGSHRLLCAHRHGPAGVSRWSALAEQWIRQDHPSYHAGLSTVGTPVSLTRNDDVLGVSNGDAGVIVATATGRRLAVETPHAPRLVATALVQSWEPLHASTIHKAQGSQFDAVTVVVPGPHGYPLTRELLYTAITRARFHLRLIGDREAILDAVTRPALRASGLAARLRRTQGMPVAR
ncbi:MAG: exodeoxyribonuclease V subunit alpha [Propionibacteriaceae bacterium]|jgi:exodeoxyribonuclease V alpha subunit|nr:exodeoxyribonuclease V subunit alpha [Propionibacteriaceae bacterium]